MVSAFLASWSHKGVESTQHQPRGQLHTAVSGSIHCTFYCVAPVGLLMITTIVQRAWRLLTPARGLCMYGTAFPDRALGVCKRLGLIITARLELFIIYIFYRQLFSRFCGRRQCYYRPSYTQRAEVRRPKINKAYIGPVGPTGPINHTS